MSANGTREEEEEEKEEQEEEEEESFRPKLRKCLLDEY